MLAVFVHFDMLRFMNRHDLRTPEQDLETAFAVADTFGVWSRFLNEHIADGERTIEKGAISEHIEGLPIFATREGDTIYVLKGDSTKTTEIGSLMLNNPHSNFDMRTWLFSAEHYEAMCQLPSKKHITHPAYTFDYPQATHTRFAPDGLESKTLPNGLDIMTRKTKQSTLRGPDALTFMYRELAHLFDHGPCSKPYLIGQSKTRLIAMGDPEVDAIADNEQVLARVGNWDVADIPKLLTQVAFSRPDADDLSFAVRHLAWSPASTQTIVTSSPC